MARRALIVGIDEYDSDMFPPLTGCVADAGEMAEVLARNYDGSVNFACRLAVSSDPPPITRAYLRQQWRELFRDFREDVLFYFSGHGSPNDIGGFLVTQEGTPDDPGLLMSEIVDLANESCARTVLIVLDCCFSGHAGNAAARQGGIENKAILREGVTILAASRPSQVALEVGGHGVFTNLIVGALKGGASDVRGRVSAAAVYAYAEAALGPFDQRPLYKSHAAGLEPVRTCAPRVPDAMLREVISYFRQPDDLYKLDPTYEETHESAVSAHVAIFQKFKQYQVGGLLQPISGRDLYWTALRSERVTLTDLGRFYHTLVTRGCL